MYLPNWFRQDIKTVTDKMYVNRINQFLDGILQK